MTEAATWPDDIKVAVNVSPVQFKSGNFAQMVINALAASRLPASRLELEITEAVLIRDDEAALAVLHQLRGLGVRIAMDDFGTGYSSLSYLQRFPFDKIKIDRSFIKDIAEADGSLSIVQAVVSIAKSRNITTTAEGVETEQQLEVLRSAGLHRNARLSVQPPGAGTGAVAFLPIECSGAVGQGKCSLITAVDSHMAGYAFRLRSSSFGGQVRQPARA